MEKAEQDLRACEVLAAEAGIGDVIESLEGLG
jgi:hypothetical protein